MPLLRPHRAEAVAGPEPLFLGSAAHEYPDPELGHFRRPPYSVWSAMKFILVLSVFLWWLPTFGQMIAGYIGGRRAGGPWRGIAAAIMPVALIVVLSWGAERGLLAPWLTGIVALPNAAGDAIAGWFTPAAPYVTFVLGYLAAFIEALKATLAMGSNGYLVTVVFAYIGGILADQSRREVAYGRGTSVGISITQPIVAPFRPALPAWEGRHPERFEEFDRLPVANAQIVPRFPPPHPGTPHKVHAHQADVEGEEGERPSRDAKPRPERQEPTAHDKELATRRFVERALRQYEAAHRR